MNTRGLIKKALMKDESFNQMITALKERLEIFDKKYSLDFFEVKFTVQAPLVITSHRKDAIDSNWLCKIYRSKLNYVMQFDLTIQSSWEMDNLKKDINNVINSVVDNIMSTCRLCRSWEDISIIEVSLGHTYINNLISWGDKYIGIYHEEQECGEGWITAPIKPNLYEQKTIIRRKDESETIMEEDKEVKRLRGRLRER